MSADEHSDSGCWEKLKKYAKKAGRGVIEKALWLYYAAQEPATPIWARTAIYGALAYFLSPIDAIPDVSPIVGYRRFVCNRWGYGFVSMYIKIKRLSEMNSVLPNFPTSPPALGRCRASDRSPIGPAIHELQEGKAP